MELMPGPRTAFVLSSSVERGCLSVAVGAAIYCWNQETGMCISCVVFRAWIQSCVCVCVWWNNLSHIPALTHPSLIQHPNHTASHPTLMAAGMDHILSVGKLMHRVSQSLILGRGWADTSVKSFLKAAGRAQIHWACSIDPVQDS